MIIFHAFRILGAFFVSLIFIKLIQLWITFNRRKSLKMKLKKRYTHARNEILNIMNSYKLNMIIFFPISVILDLLFIYYVSVVCAVYRYSCKYLVLNWFICIGFHLVYSLLFNFIPTILRYLSLKKENRNCMYTTSRILSYCF